MTLVDLVVATHNQPELLSNCLASLRAMNFRDYRLIVVDDASSEPAARVVERVHPGATVLRSQRNVGLVGALNHGISRGTSPLVALLNDDTEVEHGWLGALVNAAGRYPEAASFASKMLLFDDPPRFHSAGDGFRRWGMPYNRGVWLDDLGQYDDEESVFGACAGAALYRRGVLDAVAFAQNAFLDPRLFMYLEDVDVAWRFRRRGWTCQYIPSAVVRHHLSASGGGILASYCVSRNIWLVLSRSAPRSYLQQNRRSILAYHTGRNLRHLRHLKSPEARASLRGSFAGLMLVVGGGLTGRWQRRLRV